MLARKRLLFLGAVFVLVLVILSLTKTIYKTYLASRRVGMLEQEVWALAQRKRALEKEFAAKNTLEFVEAEARNRLGMVKEGEQIVVIAQKEELVSAEKKKQEELARLTNPQKWWYLFFGSGRAP